MSVKKVTKKTEKTEYKVLNVFYYSDVLIDNNDLRDYLDETCDITYTDVNGNHDIYFEIDELPYCCGVLEIGNLKIDKTFPLIAFKQLMSELLRSYASKTIIINTNGKNTCPYWENHLENCDELFTLVKTFKNTSGNLIKMWISNNNK